eukprot:scpid47939/ scgid23240/ Uncharacterized protein C12orf4 homolog
MAVTKTFEFSFRDENREKSLSVPIQLPFGGQKRDFMERLMLAHKLPAYVKSSLEEQLLLFVKKETQQIQDEESEKMLDALASGEKANNLGSIEDEWVAKYVAEHAACSGSVEQSEEAAFAQVYYSLIHSPALNTLLQLEHSYASNVEQEIIEMERSRAKMQERHSAEVERAVAHLGTKVTDQDINRLTSKHFEETEMFETQCVSSLSGLVDSQRQEYRDWVASVQHDSLGSISARPTERSRARHSRQPSREPQSAPPRAPVLEESFTIHLGAQMKTMHNLRLISCDVLDLCRHHPQGGDGGLSPQRIQTAMTLYSSSLAGMVLLVDNRINSFVGIKKDFAEICKRSTEFHFPELDKQLDAIREGVLPLHQNRSTVGSQAVSPSSSGTSTPAVSPSGLTTDSQQSPDDALLRHSSSSDSRGLKNSNVTLRTGDFYVTRHSNLSQVHCVFHLAVDDSVRSNQLSSRQPCIVGLRNVLHHAAMHNVFNISVPLLLSHEMTEEMTLQWCLKRAEMVFKCVKGFMMENSSWSGTETRTIQFVLPPGISDSVFTHFTAMLPNIFRVANALDLR